MIEMFLDLVPSNNEPPIKLLLTDVTLRTGLIYYKNNNKVWQQRNFLLQKGVNDKTGGGGGGIKAFVNKLSRSNDMKTGKSQ